MKPSLYSLTSAMLALAANEISDAAQHARERRWQADEQDRRIAEAEAIRNQVAEENQHRALRILEEAGKPLRWTQISVQLNPLSLAKVRAFLKAHPNVEYRKAGKREFLRWRSERPLATRENT